MQIMHANNFLNYFKLVLPAEDSEKGNHFCATLMKIFLRNKKKQ